MRSVANDVRVQVHVANCNAPPSNRRQHPVGDFGDARSPIDVQRASPELLAELESAADAPTVTQLVHALIVPDIEMAAHLEGRGGGRARLLGQIYLDPAAFVTSNVEERFTPVAVRFHPHLIGALPELPPELLAWRIRWCLFGTLGAVLADRTEPSAFTDTAVAAHLVATIAGALAAPETTHRSTP